MASYESTITCDVDGCQEQVSGASERTYEKAKADAELIAIKRGWLISWGFNAVVHICGNHIKESNYTKTN